MKRILVSCLFAILFLPSFVLAQPSAVRGAISGVVKDVKTGEPILSATAALWSAVDSTLVSGSISDLSGAFEIIGVPPGQYEVRLSFIGYQPKIISRVEISSGAPLVDLGVVDLELDVAMLDAIEVIADRNFVEVGIDRTVYNTKDQIVAAGGSAANVLENIPAIEVDVDGNISFRGNQNVAILINGRPAPVRGAALAGFLQGLSGESVERVEVIPNPSAKYEPDGMAGIVNIVLKKDTRVGVNGTLIAGVGSTDDYNASGNINYRKGRLNLFANYGFRYDSRDAFGSRFRETLVQSPSTSLRQYRSESRLRRSHVINTVLDYTLSSQNTLSLSSLFSTRPSKENELTDTFRFDAARSLIDQYDRRALSTESALNTDNALSWRRVVEATTNELLVELRVRSNRDDEEASFTEQDRLTPDLSLREQQRNDITTNSNDVALQVDYVRPMLGGRVEAGYKGTFRQLDNSFFLETLEESGLYAPETSLNNAFAYDDNVQAAYGIYGRELGKLGLQAGVRLEQATTSFTLENDNSTFDNDYFSVFPSAFLTYQLSPKRSAKLSYSKRVNRPGTRQLNPFTSYEDPLNRRLGNPTLRPEYVHAFEAGLTQYANGFSLTLSPYFRRTVDVIRRYLTVDDQGIATLTYENFDTSDSFGFEAIGTVQVRGRFNAYASLNAYRVVTDASNVEAGLTNEAIGWTTRLNATYTIVPSLDVQLSYFYRAPMDIEGGRIQAFAMTNIALRQKLMGDRANLSLRVNDPFNQSGFGLWRGNEQFYLELDRKWQSRSVLATFTLNFGERQASRSRRNSQPERSGGGADIDF